MANTATGQSSADAAAQQRAAEERAKRRAYIQSQIQQWNTKLTTVNSQIAGLTAEQSNLITYLGDWDTMKNFMERMLKLMQESTDAFEQVDAGYQAAFKNYGQEK